jgi:hypothetical protein
VLDQLYAGEVKAAAAMFESRRGQRRATTDINEAARAATIGAVDMLLVDINRVIAGTVDEAGTVSQITDALPRSYDVIDEIAGRAIDAGAKVLGVREADIPNGAPLAALLRYPMRTP